MHLDSKYNELKKNLGNIGESKILLITAIQMVDDYFALNKKVNSKKNEFEKLSIKFKELRSLALNYKDEKEKEIEKLRSELNKFETLIEENRSSYEEILDKTTKSIEKFIENAETAQEQNVQ
jgi:cell division protein ZapA